MIDVMEIPVTNPQALLERQILGAMMRWPRVLDDFVVDGEWFDDDLHRRVYAKIRQVWGVSDVADPSLLTVGEVNPFVHKVFECFGDCFAAQVSFEYYLEKLKESWAKRVLMAFAQGLLGEGQDVDDQIDSANRILERLSQVQDEDVIYTPAEYLSSYRVEMSSGDAFMPTSWRRLNKIIGGWRDSGLYVIGGRPGQGKTIVLLQAAWDLASSGRKVLFVSLEMPVKQLQHRILAQALSLDVSAIADNKLNFDVMSADGSKASAKDLVADAQIVLNDNLLMFAPAEITPTKLRSIMKKQLRQGDLDAVFVDYLQIADDDAKHSVRNDEIRAISGKFKKIAKQFDLPLITAVQLNREVENRAKGKPKLTDIGESDKIGMDADVAIMIHREHQSGDDPDAQGSDLYLYVVKNRHGRTGAARFVAQDAFSRITEKTT